MCMIRRQITHQELTDRNMAENSSSKKIFSLITFLHYIHSNWKVTHKSQSLEFKEWDLWVTLKFKYTIAVLFPFALFCNLVAGTFGEWQAWGEWSQCTTSCGAGSKFRSRTCSEPTVGGDQKCPGKSTEAAPCMISECQGSLCSCLLFYPFLS